MKKSIYNLILFISFFGINAVQAQDDPVENFVYRETEVDSVPVFPGGIAAMQKYVQDNIKDVTVENCAGMAVVSFIVEKNGEVTFLDVSRKLCPSANIALEKMIAGMPVWTPAKKRGEPVRMRIDMPVQFLLPVKTDTK